MKPLALPLMLVTLSLGTSSCSTPAPMNCERTCGGCCDANGTCQLGTANNACGAQGMTCQTCPLALTCSLGSCVSGGLGGGTGGGSTGGGSGANDGGTTGGGSSGGGNPCAGTLALCGSACTDLTTALDSCGACGLSCGNGQVCIQGSCRLFPDDCTAAACGAGFSCDPMTRKCVAGCRLMSDCPQGATCTNGTCACPSGQHACGQRCVRNSEVGSCGSACQACATPANGSPTCDGTDCAFACNVGFTRVGDTCADVDECQSNNGGCDANATCTNTVGARTCACKAGFTGSGLTCSDVDECATNNGGCGTNGTCQNTPGSFTCSCASGTVLQGGTCVDVDECQNGTAGCAANATCANRPGSFTCTCNPGFTGDGRVCQAGHDFVVLVVGNGAAPLGMEAAEVHLERRRSDGSLVSDTPLPTAVSGANRHLTLRGSATTEGIMSLSQDGRFVLLAGYATAPGTTSFDGLPRVVGRVSLTDGTVDTSTRFTSLFAARSAASVDGSVYWVGASSEGVRMVVHGSVGASTEIFTMPSATRQVLVNGGQLYVATATSINKVGTGLPMSSATLTALPGVSAPGVTGFALFDLNPAVAGPDRLYFSDSSLVSRFDFNGTTWSPTATWAAPTGQVHSMGAASDPNAVTIVVTGSFGVMRISDTGVSGSQPAGPIVLPPPANKAFRGVVVL